MSNINTILIKFLVISMLFFLFSCKCKTCELNSSNIQVPDSIFTHADKYVSGITGDELFNDYFIRDNIKSEKQDNKYWIHYRFKMLDNYFVNEDVSFFVDTLGNILLDENIIGIPNCLENPTNCQFFVDEEEAFDIAEKEGMKKVEQPWNFSFRWSTNLEKYVWHIVSTNSEIKGNGILKSSGEEIMIDPYNGEVITFGIWEIK